MKPWIMLLLLWPTGLGIVEGDGFWTRRDCLAAANQTAWFHSCVRRGVRHLQ